MLSALVWNPLGDGGFTLKDCVVTRVDYADGSSATTADQDPLVGQPVSAVKNAAFPLAATLVDLDVEQQGVSEIWALSIQIGGSTMGIRGDFAPRFTGRSSGNSTACEHGLLAGGTRSTQCGDIQPDSLAV